jgi:hypothetical protein
MRYQEHIKSGSVVVKFHIKQSAKNGAGGQRADLGPNSHHPPSALTQKLLAQVGDDAETSLIAHL